MKYFPTLSDKNLKLFSCWNKPRLRLFIAKPAQRSSVPSDSLPIVACSVFLALLYKYQLCRLTLRCGAVFQDAQFFGHHTQQGKRTKMSQMSPMSMPSHPLSLEQLSAGQFQMIQVNRFWTLSCCSCFHIYSQFCV